MGDYKSGTDYFPEGDSKSGEKKVSGSYTTGAGKGHKKFIKEISGAAQEIESEQIPLEQKVLRMDKLMAEKFGYKPGKIEEQIFDSLYTTFGYNRYRKKVKVKGVELKERLRNQKKHYETLERELSGKVEYESKPSIKEMEKYDRRIPDSKKGIEYKLAFAQDKNRLLFDKRDEAEAQLAEVKGTIRSIEDEIAEYRQDLTPENRVKINNLNKEISNYQREKHDLETALGAYDGKIKVLGKRIVGLAKKREGLRRSTDAADRGMMRNLVRSEALELYVNSIDENQSIKVLIDKLIEAEKDGAVIDEVIEICEEDFNESIEDLGTIDEEFEEQDDKFLKEFSERKDREYVSNKSKMEQYRDLSSL